MSDNNDSSDQITGAPTLLDNVLRTRREQGRATADDDSSDDQITTRQINPNADDMEGPAPSKSNIAGTRRIQQPAEPSEEEQEEIRRAHDAMGNALFGERRYTQAKEKRDKGKEPDDTTPSPPPEDDKAKKKTAKPGPKVSKEPPKFTMSQDDIARLGTTIAASVRESSSQPQSTPDAPGSQPDPTEGLDEDDRYQYQVALQMQETNESRYKDLPKQMLEMFTRKAEYKEAWKKENPDEKFDWDDEAHRDFLNNATPEFKLRDFDDARVDLRAKQIASKSNKELQSKLEELETQQVASSLQEQSAKDSQKAVREFQEEFVPEADYDLGTAEGRKEARENEDLLGDVMVRYSDLVDAATSEVSKVYRSNNKYTFKPDNKLHQWIGSVVSHYEKVMASAPAEETRNSSGQTYMPYDQWIKLPDSQKGNHWIFGMDQVMWAIKAAAVLEANEAKQVVIDRTQASAKARGWKFDPETIVSRRKNANQNRSQSRRSAPVQRPAAQKQSDTPPPESPSGSSTDTRSDSRIKSNETFAQMMTKRLFPRREKSE